MRHEELIGNVVVLVVGREFSVQERLIRDTSYRYPPALTARWFAIWLLVRHCRLTSSAAARALGMGESSIVYGLRRVEQRIARDAPLTDHFERVVERLGRAVDALLEASIRGVNLQGSAQAELIHAAPVMDRVQTVIDALSRLERVDKSRGEADARAALHRACRDLRRVHSDYVSCCEPAQIRIAQAGEERPNHVQ